jgi:RNA recognition motif-containing protein
MEENLSKQVFVAGLEWGIRDGQLKEFFESQGLGVESAVVVMGPNGRSKGFGFVTFTDAEHANRAINELNGHVLVGRAIVVKPKEERKPAPRFGRDS